MDTMSAPPAAPAVVDAPGAAAVVAGLRATFATGRTRDLAWRLAQLDGIDRMVADHEADIAAALAADLGRARVDAWLADVAPVRAEVAYARRHLRSWMRPTRTGLPLALRPGRAHTRHEPLGTVLVIGPWNYPVYLTLGPLVGAVAAGNAVVVKPSEHAPVTSALLARLLPAHIDPAAVAVVEGDASVTQELIAQGLDHVFFTGGPEIGKRIMAAAAPHLTPVTLELGGKSPTIVTRHADLDVAARRIAWTKLLNSGQTCIAPDYVLVERPVRDALVTKVAVAVAEMSGGKAQPMRIVDRRQYDRLTAVLDGARAAVAVGGGTDDAACTIEPTIVVDADPLSRLMTEEIFGPILPVVTVASLDEAISHVVSRPKPLAAYLFSSDTAEQRRVIEEVSAGGIVVNHAAMHVLAPQLPFGGVGTSGMGTYHGRWGFETFSHRKSVLVKPARPDLSFTYPPYSRRTERLLRRLF